MINPFNTTVIIPSVCYDPILKMPICLSQSCKYAVQDDGFRRHLRQVHNIKGQQLQELVDIVNNERTANQHVTNNDLHDAYMATTEMNYRQTKILPLHPLLAKVNALKCAACSGILRDTQKSKNSHSCPTKQQQHTQNPGSSDSHAIAPTSEGFKSHTYTKVTAQSVYGGKKIRLFQVSNQMMENSYPVLPPPSYYQ